MGELHLQVMAAKLQRDFHVEINLGQPRVAYRESLSAPYRFCEVFSRKLPGREVSVFLDVEFTPNPDEELPVIINDLVAEKEKGLFLVLKETARKALETELASGPMHGFPMSQIKARIHSCRASLADSLPSPEDLELALNLLVRELGRRVELSILEPWMLVELTVPEDYLSPVLGDLQAKGGSILQVEVQSKLAEVRALVALSKMLAYSTRLRSLSQGRGSYSMKLDRYRELSQEARKQLLGLA